MADGLTAADIMALIRSGESQTVEFKSEGEKQKDIAELLAALANAEGGTVLFGISDDGEVIGVSKPHAIIQTIAGAGRGCQPQLNSYLTAYTVEVEGKQVVVATLPPLEGLYSTNSIYRRRHGVENIVVYGDDLKHLALERMSGDFDSHPLELGLDALDPRKADALLAGRVSRALDGESIPLAGYPNLVALSHLKKMRALVEVGGLLQPTAAGLLILGRNPQEQLPHARVQASAFADQGMTFLDRQLIGGTLDEQLTGVVAFVRRNTRQGAEIGAVLREERPQYPPRAVREAVANALLHRNYGVRAPISLYIFPDRIEVVSPGGLLPGLSPSDIEGQHLLRNHALGPLMYYAGLAETFGTGFWRIREALAEAGLPPFELRQSGDWLRLILYSETEQPIPPVEVSQVLPRFRGTQSLRVEELRNINVRQVRLLEDFHNGRVSRLGRNEYGSRYQVSPATAGRDLNHLVELGLLKKLGAGPATVYELLEHGGASVEDQVPS